MRYKKCVIQPLRSENAAARQAGAMPVKSRFSVKIAAAAQPARTALPFPMCASRRRPVCAAAAVAAVLPNLPGR